MVANAQPEHGYVSITRDWRRGDTVELDLPMPVHQVTGNPHIAATASLVALERGPVVYCVEELGQKVVPDSLAAPLDIAIREQPALLGGVTVLEIKGHDARPLTAIPYFAWNNRGLAPMAVWLPQPAK